MQTTSNNTSTKEFQVLELIFRDYRCQHISGVHYIINNNGISNNKKLFKKRSASNSTGLIPIAFCCGTSINASI